MAECAWGKNYRRSKAHRKQAAAFYKAIMKERPSAVNFLKVLHQQNFIAEEAISLVDKDNTCLASHDEWMGFMQKWAHKKH